MYFVITSAAAIKGCFSHRSCRSGANQQPVSFLLGGDLIYPSVGSRPGKCAQAAALLIMCPYHHMLKQHNGPLKTLMDLPDIPRALIATLIESKNASRLACRSLKTDVDREASSLRWIGKRGPSAEGAASSLLLPAQMLAACTSLSVLDCRGLWLQSLLGCPTTLVELKCSRLVISSWSGLVSSRIQDSSSAVCI